MYPDRKKINFNQEQCKTIVDFGESDKNCEEGKKGQILKGNFIDGMVRVRIMFIK